MAVLHNNNRHGTLTENSARRANPALMRLITQPSIAFAVTAAAAHPPLACRNARTAKNCRRRPSWEKEELQYYRHLVVLCLGREEGLYSGTTAYSGE